MTSRAISRRAGAIFAAAFAAGAFGAFPAAAAPEAARPTPAPGRKRASTPAAPAPKKASATPKALPPIYESYLVGEKAIAAAGRVATSSGRRVLVNFGTNDCDACRVVNDAIYDPVFLEPFMKQFIPVFIDVSPSNPNRELLARYGIDPAKGLPAIVVSTKELDPAVVTRDGEVARAAANGKKAVQDWLLGQFEQSGN